MINSGKHGCCKKDNSDLKFRLKIPTFDSLNYFCFPSNARKSKSERALSFRVQSGEKTVCGVFNMQDLGKR